MGAARNPLTSEILFLDKLALLIEGLKLLHEMLIRHRSIEDVAEKEKVNRRKYPMTSVT